ncbi:MAG: hypothetical protein HRT58_19330 [Crocinitomicaceae bacterium]|nr:hypothetical protein [Flavobacteriales bacterium]NQZ37823.1 hypothetical protein [Crocinitomicaceae bacterium]
MNDFSKAAGFANKRFSQHSAHSFVWQSARMESDTIHPGTISPMHELIYVNGYIRTEFTSIGLEKEFERCVLFQQGEGRQYFSDGDATLLKATKHRGKLNEELYSILSKPQNAYIAREITWVLVSEYGNDLYTLKPSESQLLILIEALKSNDDKNKLSVMVVGRAVYGNGNDLAELSISKVVEVSSSSIVEALRAKNPSMNKDKLESVVQEIFSLCVNNGDTEKDRALNYILHNNLEIYERSYEIKYDTRISKGSQPGGDLSAVQVIPEMSGKRILAKINFDYDSNNGSPGQSWFSVVDVSDEFPFLLAGFKRYLQRY